MEKMRFLNYISSINPEDRQKTERILKKIISKYMNDPRKSYSKRYELEHFNSKDIEKLLTLLENSMSNIRKLTLLVIGLVLMNPLSKIFFLEKCGLSLVIGRCFLTRLKYVYNFSNNQRSATKNVLKIMKILKIAGTGPQGTMFWYISLDLERNRMPEDFHPQLHEFRVRNMFDKDGNLDLSLVPDPVYHLCGLEFFDSDKQMKIDYQLRLQQGQPEHDPRLGRPYAQSTITGSNKAKMPKSSYAMAGKGMERSGVYKAKPFTGYRMKMMRGSAKTELEGYKGGKNQSLYFRSNIHQGSGARKHPGKVDTLNNISRTMVKTLKNPGNFKQSLQNKFKGPFGKGPGQGSSKTPRTLGNKIKLKLQNSLATNSKRGKNKPQKGRLSANMSPFQFGTNSTHTHDRRNTFNYSAGLQSSVHEGKMSDLRSKLGVKGAFGMRGGRGRGKFEGSSGRFTKGFKTGNHN